MDFVVTFLFWLVFATLYLGPSIVAVCRNHYRALPIIAVNIFLGWTIIGLFWAFAWALSATRPASMPGDLPTDFAERLFQNRNVIRQPDGGAIVYPGFLADEAYWLGAADFRSYLEMRANERFRNFPRALIIVIGGTGFYLGFRHAMGADAGTAPAMLAIIAFTFFISAWDLVFRPRRTFLAAFPKAPRTQDPIRRQRKTLAELVTFDPIVCFGATILCFGLIGSLAISFLVGNQQLLLRSQDGAMLILGITILGAGGIYYGNLAWHHARFLASHHRMPNQSDLDALGTGVKAPQAAAGGSGSPATVPSGYGTRGLAAALRLGARHS